MTLYPKRINFAAYGFTLIEIIVVMSVIGILSTIGIAAFADYSRAQAVRIAAADLSTMLNTARSRAQSQVKPDSGDCSNIINLPLVGYDVRIFSSGPPADYRLRAICGTSPYNPVPIDKKVISGLTISPSPFHFSFEASTGYVFMSSSPFDRSSILPSVPLTVSDSYGNSKDVVVYSDGRIILQ